MKRNILIGLSVIFLLLTGCNERTEYPEGEVIKYVDKVYGGTAEYDMMV